MGTVTVRVLGGFQVSVDGRTVPDGAWRHRRGADLVKLLALSPEQRLHREQVMDALWPDLDPAAAGANLRKAVHFARRALGSEDAVGTKEGLVSLFPGLAPVVDSARFEAAARHAIDAGDRSAAEDAAALHAGELLPADRYAEWTIEPRAHVRDLFAGVLRTAEMWERLIEIDPADEQAHRELMRGYLNAGNRHAAMRQFERLRDALRAELGVAPDAESVSVYEKILALEGHEPPTPAERARALLAWGLVHLNRQEMAEAERSAREALDLAVQAQLAHELGEASALLALTAHARGTWRETFREEFRHAVVTTPAFASFVFDANLCFAEFALYDPAGQEHLAPFAKELLGIAEDAGSVHGRALATLLLGEIELLSGRLERAVDDLAKAVELHDGPDAVSGRTLALTRLGEAVTARGRRSEAARLLRRALTLATDAPMSSHLLTRVFGAMVQAAPSPARAVGVVDKGKDRMSGREVCQPCSMSFHVAATHACAGAGQLARAHSHLDEADRICGMWQSGPWTASVWEARGAVRLAEGDRVQAAALFKEAADVFAGVGRTIDEARCRVAAAAAG